VPGIDAGFGVALAGLGKLLGQRADRLCGVLFLAGGGGGRPAGICRSLAGLGQGRLSLLPFGAGPVGLLFLGSLPGQPVLLGALPRGAFPVRPDPRCLFLARLLARCLVWGGAVW
jgi:hypothetical protein